MKVVGIHGIAQQFKGDEVIKEEWLPALNSGLNLADADPVDPMDFAAVFYGHLFRPPNVRSSGVPPLTAKNVDTEWEHDMLLLWWKAAAELAAENRKVEYEDDRGEDPTIQGPDFVGRGTPGTIQLALRQLSKSRFFKGIGPQRFLIFGLKQVRLFLDDPTLKKDVLARVEDVVTSETRMIIGHSLGSVVAYEALCKNSENSDWNVHTFVSIGSPLGISNLVFDALTPKPKGGRGVWPSVKRWINIADKGDIVALEKNLAPKFGSVQDLLVYNGHDSHSIVRYLTALEAGNAIASCLAEIEA